MSTSARGSEQSSSTGSGRQQPSSSVKDTLTSIVIAFTLAFVFRGFVVEGFVIPTGSMAPTLMGMHMRMHGSTSGYEWQVGPWHYGPGEVPISVQAPTSLVGRAEDARGIPVQSVEVADPMSGVRQSGADARDVPALAGDRVFVLKYLHMLFEPSRWDVVVFKDPTQPQQNFIKRLVAMPGEDVALVDGDVFVRETGGDAEPAPWSAPDWTIARKGERVQRAVWQRVFDSSYAPTDVGVPFEGPWARGGAGGLWEADRRSYRFESSGDAVATLDWDGERRRSSAFSGKIPGEVSSWSVNDFYPYNENTTSMFGGIEVFPVSDVRLAATVAPDDGSRVGVTARVSARGHDFRARVEPTDGSSAVVLEMRATGGEVWTELGRGTGPGLDRRREVEFWHVDQALWLFIDGKRVAHAVYDWSPADRLARAVGRGYDEFMAEDRRRSFSLVSDPASYTRPALGWTFESTGGFTLTRVRVDRDLHYQARTHPGGGGLVRAGDPMRATHPTKTRAVLGEDQFFVLGDNSPASSDGRAWLEPDPWVAALVDPTPSVVHRDLLSGKAFFVYLPALHRPGGRLLVPDFGRMRFIR